MLDIHIISVGSLKEDYWRQAADEYLKRLKPYAKITLVEVPEEPIAKITDRQQILIKEAAKIKKHIPENAVILALDRAGVEYGSPEWAHQLEQWSRFGKKIVFIIGGPLGLHSELLTKANQLISFSKMTFTHQMIRIIMLEQLYRGSMIIQGKQYHY